MAYHWIGCDLGKMTNPAALAVVELSPLVDASGNPYRTSTGQPRQIARVVGLRRFALGCEYTEVVGFLGQLMGRPDLPGCRLAVDCTGVGLAVLEMIDRTVPHNSCVNPVIITGGTHARREGRYIHCPKSQLAGSIRAALEWGDLIIAQGLEYADLLKKEMLSFEVRITRAANEVFEAEAGAWDDLVIATALPLFVAAWLDSQQMFIAGPPERVFPEAPSMSAAMRAVTYGGRFVPGGSASLFGREKGGSGIIGDPGGHHRSRNPFR
jgi:hypothetical protein